MNGELLIVGGAFFDFAARGSRLPERGESVSAADIHSGPGGKGANAAVAAARLRATPGLLSRVGRDERGKIVLRRLREEGVLTDLVVQDPNEPTGIALIHVDDSGEKQTCSHAGALRKLDAEDVREAAEAICDAGVVLVQLEIRSAAVAEVLRIARSSSRPLVLDPAPARPIPDAWLQGVTLVCPNPLEASILTGLEVRDPDSARAAARRLLDRGAGAAAVPAGHAGKLLVWEAGELWLPRLAVDVVDTTGAGDAFSAAAAVQLMAGASWEEIGHFANAASALATTALGAQSALPDRAAVLDLLGR